MTLKAKPGSCRIRYFGLLRSSLEPKSMQMVCTLEAARKYAIGGSQIMEYWALRTDGVGRALFSPDHMNLSVRASVIDTVLIRFSALPEEIADPAC